MIKILAFGDTHISERHALCGGNVRGADGERRSLADARRYFAWLVELAQEEAPDVILCAGDLFDRARPSPAEYDLALDALRKLAAQAPVAVIPGNHDLPSGADADALRPLKTAQIEGVVFLEQLGERVELVCDDSGPRLAIYALPYPPSVATSGEGREADNARASQALNVALADMAQRAQLDAERGIATCLLAHVTFSGGRYVADQTAPAYDLLAPVEPLRAFDLVVAGHLHQRQQIGGLYHAVYTGTGDRWSFSQEEEDCGAVAFELREEEERGSQWRLVYRWQNWDARPFHTFKPNDLRLDMPRGGAFVRVVGDVTDPREYDAILAKLAAWRSKGSYVRCDVTLNAQRGALAAVEETASVETLFSAYLLAKPDAIPSDLQSATLERVRRILASADT